MGQASAWMGSNTAWCEKYIQNKARQLRLQPENEESEIPKL